MPDTALLKYIADRGSISRERSQLQRFDWLETALDIFVTEGIEAVRITRLADELGVTRGSFYWHFPNREDLVNALVSYWRDKNTSAIVDAIGDLESLVEGIFNLFEICIDARFFDPRLDLAIREWARRSEQIRGQVDEADRQRVQSITDFFLRCGYAMPEALIRARVIYFAQIGFYALDVREPLDKRISYTEAYFECFTGRSLDSEAAEGFRLRIRKKYGKQPQ